MEFGKSLREAREAKGYTVAQVAETTHIMTSVIEGLEKEDFSRIAAPIYGRGFVKLYCEAVGLETKPFVDEFMAIMNGEHEIRIKERPVTTTEPSPDPAVTPEPPPREPIAERDLFTQDKPTPAAEPISEAEPISGAEPISNAEPAKAGLSRYATPFRTENRAPLALPVLPWRLILLGIACLAILLILAFGVRALYRATATRPVAETKPAARAQQQDIPSLYVD